MSDLGTKRPLICYHSTTLLTHRVRRNPRHHALNDGDSCDIVAQLSLPAPGLPPPSLFEPRLLVASASRNRTRRCWYLICSSRSHLPHPPSQPSSLASLRGRSVFDYPEVEMSQLDMVILARPPR